MPLYDYYCGSCNATAEIIVPMARRDDAPPCACGGKMVRQMTGGSFILIGGGWQGRSHVRVKPPESDRAGMDGVDRDGYHTNYYNCTPESVHRI